MVAGKRELGGRAAFRPGRSFNPVHQFEVVLEVFHLETRPIPTPIAFGEIFDLPDLVGQETLPQWTLGDETDAQFTTDGQNLAFDVPRP